MTTYTCIVTVLDEDHHALAELPYHTETPDMTRMVAQSVQQELVHADTESELLLLHIRHQSGWPFDRGVYVIAISRYADPTRTVVRQLTAHVDLAVAQKVS